MAQIKSKHCMIDLATGNFQTVTI